MSNATAELAHKTKHYQHHTLPKAHTKWLDREVEVEIFLPPSYEEGSKFPLLVLNDGQDNPRIRLGDTLNQLTEQDLIEPIVVVTVACGPERIQEYGVAARADYLHRGSKAKAYTRYIIDELIPYLLYQYKIDANAKKHAIAGYSLGGLSALDIAWNNPHIFQTVGAFSGSFWWRRCDANSMFYSNQHDRIMHRQVRIGKFKPGMKFWFQTGTLDESEDRNKNGVIDSIDDTLDLISELVKKGYRAFHDIQYYEIKGGQHNPETWALAMPHFLQWAFGKTV